MLIAIAFSDIHLYRFRVMDKNDSRLDWSCKALIKIGEEANRLKVPALFCGDFFHMPKEIDNFTLSQSIKAFRTGLGNIPVIGISGNHDLAEKNGWDHRSPSYLDSLAAIFTSFYKVDYRERGMGYQPGLEPWFNVWGLPYMNNEAELRSSIKKLRKYASSMKDVGYKILLLHGDAPGAEDFSGHTIEKTDAIPNLDKFFEPWDLVLMGHIHKPQKLSDKVYMLGSPIHQISSDRGEMGYWQIFNDQPPKFVGLEGFPKFRRLRAGKKPKNDLDYWIEDEEQGKIEKIEAGEFNVNQSRKKLAKKYLAAKGIKDQGKEKALINILNQAE